MMSRSTTTRRPSLSRQAATLLALLIGAALVVFPAGSAQALTGEGMQSFDVVYDLQPDGSVQVKETIVWQFPPGEQRRGIYRDIIVRMGWNDEEGKYRY
jgi:hypothetical protein